MILTGFFVVLIVIMILVRVSRYRFSIFFLFVSRDENCE